MARQRRLTPRPPRNPPFTNRNAASAACIPWAQQGTRELTLRGAFRYVRQYSFALITLANTGKTVNRRYPHTKRGAVPLLEHPFRGGCGDGI